MAEQQELAVGSAARSHGHAAPVDSRPASACLSAQRTTEQQELAVGSAARSHSIIAAQTHPPWPGTWQFEARSGACTTSVHGPHYH